MAQKLWEKNVKVDQQVDTFTVGKDREMDLYLAKYDVLGSMAHITMLESIGLLDKEELPILLAELKNIYKIAEDGLFVIEEGVEDVHSQVELMLTRKLGDMGKKIHSGRSRNDQVLVDLKLFTRAQPHPWPYLSRPSVYWFRPDFSGNCANLHGWLEPFSELRGFCLLT